MKRKWIKYTLWSATGFVALWIIALLVSYIYIEANKPKIAKLLNDQISQNIEGKFSFDGLSVSFIQNFPAISIELKNVRLLDSEFAQHKRELVNVDHLYLGFGLFDLIAGKKTPKIITLADGNLHVFTDSTGYKNWNVLKKQPKSKSDFELKAISFENIDAVFEDEQKFKYYDVLFHKMKCSISKRDSTINFEMTNDALLKNISFSTKRGSYVANKSLICDWQAVYYKNEKHLTLRDQSMRIDGRRYAIDGDFFFDNEPRFDLAVKIGRLPLQEAAAIFPLPTQKKINQFSLSSPVQGLTVYLYGPMKYLSFPVADIKFTVSDATLKLSTVEFEHCSFEVYFNNRNDSAQSPSDPNTVIRFANVKAQWEKNSFSGKNIYIYNLLKPYLKCGVHFDFKLNQLDKAIASPRLDLNSGDGVADLNYAGPLQKADTVYDLSGSVTVNNGDITYAPRDMHFKNTQLELLFQNGDMYVKKMHTEVNDNKITINGDVKGLLNFFNTDSTKANFEWEIYSPYVNVDRLTTSIHRTVATSKAQTYASFKNLNNKINRLFDDCNAVLDIKADKLVYNNFAASNVKGKISLNNNMVRIDNFSLNHADGLVVVNASTVDSGKNTNLALDAQMKAVNVRKLFAAFNNFGMESLKSKNINGRLSADIHLNSQMDGKNNIIRSANTGFVQLSLEDGQLENFQPLLDIDNNFLKKRNLSDIQFADLHDRFEINGNDVKVNRMEIKSTAVNMYVEGVYSFADNTDLSIQIPLLKQNKNPDDVPQKKGNDSKGGISVFLRAKNDKDGKLKIGYDPLARFRNKDKAH